MRAHISTNRCRCRQCYPGDLEQGALNEARAILAETEPAPSRETLQSIPLGLLPKVSYPILGAAEALAESLSAFLEEPSA